MSFAAPLAAETGVAEQAILSGRGKQFADGMKSLAPGGVLGFDHHNAPVIAPQKAAISDVGGNARATVNPNTILR